MTTTVEFGKAACKSRRTENALMMKQTQAHLRQANVITNLGLHTPSLAFLTSLFLGYVELSKREIEAITARGVAELARLMRDGTTELNAVEQPEQDIELHVAFPGQTPPVIAQALMSIGLVSYSDKRLGPEKPRTWQGRARLSEVHQMVGTTGTVLIAAAPAQTGQEPRFPNAIEPDQAAISNDHVASLERGLDALVAQSNSESAVGMLDDDRATSQQVNGGNGATGVLSDGLDAIEQDTATTPLAPHGVPRSVEDKVVDEMMTGTTGIDGKLMEVLTKAVGDSPANIRGASTRPAGTAITHDDGTRASERYSTPPLARYTTRSNVAEKTEVGR